MELNFLSISDIDNKAKATIHLSGKLGFNTEAAEVMRLGEVACFKVALDGDIASYQHIFLKPFKTEEDNCVKLTKTSGYYSLPLTSVFNKLSINYTDYKVIFEIIAEKYNGEDIYKLKRRPKDIKRSISKVSKEEGEE
ncbi:hypothetical protein C8E01_11787 [Pontibacter virosus]|nr:hypothetical protein C8E01_11787 [Pontibacter virosus]